MSCLASCIVLTDILSLTLKSAGLPLRFYGNRDLIILLLTVLILFPLCCMKDLDALKSVSALGLVGQLTANLALLIRIFDSSYEPGGIYSYHSIQKHLVLQKALSDDLGVVETSSASIKEWFVLASLLSYCFNAHYNVPKYYSELEGKTSFRFGKMALISYMSVGFIYVITMTLGIAVFGIESKSFLLNSLSSSDPLAIVARLAFGASVLASFPLIFLVMRNWFIALAER